MTDRRRRGTIRPCVRNGARPPPTTSASCSSITVIVAAVATTGVGQRIKDAMATEVECIATGSTELRRHGHRHRVRRRPDRVLLAVRRRPRRAAGRAQRPEHDEFSDLVDERDISVDGGETSRRFFTVEPVPGRGVVAFDFFIPSENSNGFAGDDRPEEGTDILRDDLPLNDSRVMIVIDFETGRGVIVQSETHLDGPGASTAPTSRARSRSTATAAPGTTWAGSTSTRPTRST